MSYLKTVARKWIYEIWCIICIFIWIGISSIFGFSTFGLIIGGIVAFLLFCIQVIIYGILYIKKKKIMRRQTQIICPKCLIRVDKDPGICPLCGNKL